MRKKGLRTQYVLHMQSYKHEKSRPHPAPGRGCHILSERLVRLFLFLLVAALLLLRCRRGALALDATGPSTTVGRGKGKVNVLLCVQTDNKRRDVHDLLANTVKQSQELDESDGILYVPDVALTDQDTGMVNGLGETALEHLCLEATFQEILDLQGKHVIETHPSLVEHTNAHEPANEGIAFKETLWVLIIEFEQLTRSTTDL